MLWLGKRLLLFHILLLFLQLCSMMINSWSTLWFSWHSLFYLNCNDLNSTLLNTPSPAVSLSWVSLNQRAVNQLNAVYSACSDMQPLRSKQKHHQPSFSRMMPSSSPHKLQHLNCEHKNKLNVVSQHISGLNDLLL